MDSNGTDYYMRSWLANQPISKHIWPLPKSNRHGAQKNARPAYHHAPFRYTAVFLGYGPSLNLDPAKNHKKKHQKPSKTSSLSWFTVVYHGLSWFIMVRHGLSHASPYQYNHCGCFSTIMSPKTMGKHGQFWMILGSSHFRKHTS